MFTLRMRKQSGFTLFVFSSLFALLFQYRILSLLKRLGADVTPVGTRFPIVLDFQHAPQWVLPFYHTLDYLNAVWFTTLLGLFIAGAVVAFLPKLLRDRLKGDGVVPQLTGVMLGLPNMLCSCCATSTFVGLRKTGTGLGPALACFVAAPALNLVVIILAFELLPSSLAVARLALGLVASFGAAYIVTKLVPIKEEPATHPSGVQDGEPIGEMFKRWLDDTWDIAKAVIPLLLFGLFLIGAFKTVFPFETIARHLGNGLLPIALASVVGTVLMVPTFTEVLWVGEFMRQGMGMGPAAALLITLPAVSLPSLWVVGKVLGSYKAAMFLAAFIMGLGIIGGISLSWIGV